MRHRTHRRFSGALLGAIAVMSMCGCKRMDMVPQREPASPSPSVYLEDSVLTSRVRAALILSPVVNSLDIGVESHRGVVLLSGVAADPTQIDLAVFVAQTVPGVRSVDSFMFSTGTPPLLAVSKGYTPDLVALRSRRLLGSYARNEYAGLDAPVSAPAAPAGTPAQPTAPETAPLPEDDRPSRWRGLTHKALGIRSIQDEPRIQP